MIPTISAFETSPDRGRGRQLIWILVVVGGAAVGLLFGIAQALDLANKRIAEVNRRLDALADIALGRRL